MADTHHFECATGQVIGCDCIEIEESEQQEFTQALEDRYGYGKRDTPSVRRLI